MRKQAKECLLKVRLLYRRKQDLNLVCWTPRTNTKNARPFFSFFGIEVEWQITYFLLVLHKTITQQYANSATEIRCRPCCYCKEKAKILLSGSTFLLIKQSFIQMFIKHHPSTSTVLHSTVGNLTDTVPMEHHILMSWRWNKLIFSNSDNSC